MDYVACIYENQWWLGIVKDKSNQNNNLLIIFSIYLAQKLPSRYLKDMIWVPVSKVVRKITLTELTVLHNITKTLCTEILMLLIPCGNYKFFLCNT